jgi:hypothetical protein
MGKLRGTGCEGEVNKDESVCLFVFNGSYVSVSSPKNITAIHHFFVFKKQNTCNTSNFLSEKD